MGRKIRYADLVIFAGRKLLWRASRNLCLISFLLIAMPGIVAGTTGPHGSRVERNIQFSSLSVDDGLAQVAVQAIIQDHQGFIWFGTQEGLSRYNGYRFDNFYHNADDPSSLSHEWVWALLEDKRGNLWIGTDGGGLNRYDRVSGSFIQYMHNPADHKSLSNDRVRVILEASDGTLWIGTDGGGLNRFNPRESGQGFIRYSHDPENVSASLPNDKVLAIEEDRNGNLWVGTDGGGLARLDPKIGVAEVYRRNPDRANTLSSDRVRAIFEDSQGLIWIGTEGGGINLLDPKRGTFRHFMNDATDPTSLSNNNVHNIIEDSYGALWVGTSNGLNQWVSESQVFLRYRNDPANPTSLVDDRVKVMMQDVGGVLWVGTANGVSRWNYVSDAFVYYGKTNEHDSFLTNSLVTAIDQTLDGQIWVGTYGGGLSRIDPLHNVVSHYRHDLQNSNSLSSDEVMSIFVDRDNLVWVGTRKDGLNRLNPKTGDVQRYRHNKDDPGALASDGITRIYGDSNGILWIATYGGGLNRLVPGSDHFESFRHDPDNPDSLSSDRVLTIYRDSDGILWVGTENGGLNEFDETNGSFKQYQHDPANVKSLSSNTAWDLLEGNDGSLWIGTSGGGLNRWRIEDRRARRNEFEKFGKQEGLVTNTIQAILKEASGALWLSSNRGLTRLDPLTGNTRHFDSLNALKNNDFVNGAKLHGHDGSLMFGGPDGLVLFHPDKIRSNSHSPPVVVTVLSGMRSLITSSSTDNVVPKVSVDHKDYSITFEFAALDYTSPDKNHYRYKLIGFDREWIDPTQYRRATYTNLPADIYKFQVKASNNDGVWNDVGASIELQVFPPFWRSTWAYALYILLGLGTLVLYLYLQHKKSLWESQQRAQLEVQVRERTLELSVRNNELEDLNSKLKVASLTDSLTGLKNRRFFYEQIKREIAWIKRHKRETMDGKIDESNMDGGSTIEESSLFFMMIDLDGFKNINDNHGHNAGDQALLQVRDILIKCCRTTDTLIRWGGDEFLVLGHSNGYSATERFAERVRNELADHAYDLGNGAIGKLSGSIGFAHYPFVPLSPDMLHWENVVGIADQAAYLAKQNQRNAWVGIYSRSAAVTVSNMLDIREGLHVLLRRGDIEFNTSISNKHFLENVQSQCLLQ